MKPIHDGEESLSTKPDVTGTAARVRGDDGSELGPDAAQILATEHWSLLGTRSLIWNEALSRATVFLTVLSASIISLALLADATGFGPQTTIVALGCCSLWYSCSASPPMRGWCRSTSRNSSSSSR